MATAFRALLGVEALGALPPGSTDAASVVIVAGIRSFGSAGLVALSMRSDAAVPKLREEFGYQLPIRASGNDGTRH